MPSAAAVILATEVQTRLGGSTATRLVQLTNDNNTGTTINTTVLQSAADDALGEFRVTTGGIEPDVTLTAHLMALVTGTLFYLEFYKGRDAGMISFHKKDFFNKCRSLSEMKFILASSNSVLSQSDEKSGTRPDMDRKATVFTTGGRRTTLPRKYWEDD